MDRLERAFSKHKDRIARCEDVQELLDAMAGYRRDLQVGIRDGNALLRMRAGDLLEIAEDRIAELKARGIARARRTSAPEPTPSVESAHTAEIQRLRDELAARDRQEATRQAEVRREEEGRQRRAREVAQMELQRKEARERDAREAQAREQARRVVQEERAAAARLANAQAAEVEARAALLRSQAQAAQRTQRGGPVRQERPTTPVRPPAKAARTHAAASIPARTRSPAAVIDATPRPAAPSATTTRHPQSPVARPSAPSGSIPSYTGQDLAEYRLGHKLTQRALATMLGVQQGTVCKGERRPGTPLGPTLQAAFHRLVTGGSTG